MQQHANGSAAKQHNTHQQNSSKAAQQNSSKAAQQDTAAQKHIMQHQHSSTTPLSAHNTPNSLQVLQQTHRVVCCIA